MRTLIVVASLFACLGVIAAVLVGISFSESHRKQYQFLNLLYEEQTQWLTVTVILLVMAYGAKLWKDLLSSKPQLESIHLYSGQLSQKATRHGVKTELDEADPEVAQEARAYLDAGEKDFARRRFREAADSFQKAVDVLPTMSGYMNLGVSFVCVWEFRQAEDAFISGIQIAHRKGNREFEGAFFTNLGNTYYRQGKYERALEMYRSALKFYEQSGDSVAQSAIFHNSGMVYHAQGKLDEAYKS
jgi:tetratricopeptide (TPR) repeat protein